MRSPVLGAGREFEVLRRIIGRQPMPPSLASRVVVGPGDDCVVLRTGTVAVSVDMSVEDVHFRRDWLSAEEIGYRAAVAALSDLAAVAATPIGVLASIGAGGDDAEALVERIAGGVHEAASDAGAAVLGGDVARTPGSIVVDVTVIGDAPEPVARDGAQIGDVVCVTGMLGAARAAVEAWLAGRRPDDAAALAFRRPVARIAEAGWLAERIPLHALIDLSDGLVGDAGHIAAASGVGVVLEPEHVPVHDAAARHAGSAERALALALAGGDDYELCFVAPGSDVDAVGDAFRATFGIGIGRVGYIVQGAGVRLREADGTLRAATVAGYSHFSEQGS